MPGKNKTYGFRLSPETYDLWSEYSAQFDSANAALSALLDRHVGANPSKPKGANPSRKAAKPIKEESYGDRLNLPKWLREDSGKKDLPAKKEVKRPMRRPAPPTSWDD